MNYDVPTKLFKTVCAFALLAMPFSSPAAAWCGNFYWLPAKPILVAATPTIAEHYEWKTIADIKYRKGPLIKRNFLVKLWQDGRTTVEGTVGNTIRHRKMDVNFWMRARYVSGHDPVAAWPNFSVGRSWFLGKGKRGRPNLRFRSYNDLEPPITARQFQMIGDPQFDIRPAAFCQTSK